jgi:hypothetical protein
MAPNHCPQPLPLPSVPILRPNRCPWPLPPTPPHPPTHNHSPHLLLLPCPLPHALPQPLPLTAGPMRWLLAPLRWLAFIDGDEFLVFKNKSRTHNIEEFLTDYEQYGGLAVNWCAWGGGMEGGRAGCGWDPKEGGLPSGGSAWRQPKLRAGVGSEGGQGDACGGWQPCGSRQVKRARRGARRALPSDRCNRMQPAGWPRPPRGRALTRLAPSLPALTGLFLAAAATRCGPTAACW